MDIHVLWGFQKEQNKRFLVASVFIRRIPFFRAIHRRLPEQKIATEAVRLRYH